MKPMLSSSADREGADLASSFHDVEQPFDPSEQWEIVVAGSRPSVLLERSAQEQEQEEGEEVVEPRCLEVGPGAGLFACHCRHPHQSFACAWA
mmetsp:Transcript_82751/g.221924  ORF Transcript_82751/g.221924 Transcript_82751/m.221924 type:complete len:93 (-) Transcript_82751:691-969(-)